MATPIRQRLGFYRQIAGLSAGDLMVDISIKLPSLTALSFRHIPPIYLDLLMSIFDIPKFSDLTLALDARYVGGEDGDGSQLISHLHNPAIASRVRTLTIQSLAYPCDPTFFTFFRELETLSLDFSPGALSHNYWVALTNPRTGGPSALPGLRFDEGRMSGRA
ncbi:hypothetical protein MVEN_00144800 [Mycena venus]|uniref:Uncharacterized protein n=1 Tax=Mycena venus TaxID=2733690 RepID=A0A8H7DCV5_9AGAR|nr:hypothetical protein MVEN_00144800 [Mycena venus]